MKAPQPIELQDYLPVLEAALAEDIGSGDVTCLATVPENAICSGLIFAKQNALVCGVQIARAAFEKVDSRIKVEVLAGDAQMIQSGQSVLRVRGPARGILTAERTALNFLQHLSGIATETKKYADKIAGTRARLLDTRKTLPGWRKLQKYAVACGGGVNHRIGLYDMVLIKDNHLKLMNREHPGDFSAAVARARGLFPGLKIEIEAETIDEVRLALAAGADIILLDNMTCGQMRECVTLAAGRALLEASGGVTLDTVEQIARTGVDFISVGALTHSVRAIDFSLELDDL